MERRVRPDEQAGGLVRAGGPEAPPPLEVELSHSLGALQFKIAFTATAAWTVLFGPSGSGKSTVLRAVAGLLRPQMARIAVMGEVVQDTAAGITVPPHCRPVRWVPQQSGLFPHRTVRANLELGLGAGRFGRGTQETAELERALDHFALRELAQRYPHELSGGQQQRIAVVRAALGSPGRLLLLDEAFAGLDAEVRRSLIAQLRGWLRGSPVVSVTHDVGEVLELGAEVVRFAEGRVIAQGSSAEVLRAERDWLRKLTG